MKQCAVRIAAETVAAVAELRAERDQLRAQLQDERKVLAKCRQECRQLLDAENMDEIFDWLQLFAKHEVKP